MGGFRRSSIVLYTSNSPFTPHPNPSSLFGTKPSRAREFGTNPTILDLEGEDNFTTIYSISQIIWVYWPLAINSPT